MLEWFIHGPGVDSIFACTLDNIKSLINFFLALSILKLVFIYSDGPSIPARLFVCPCAQPISLFIEILIRVFYVPNFSAFLLLQVFWACFLPLFFILLVFSGRSPLFQWYRLLVLSPRDIFPIGLLRGPWDRNERLRILRPGGFGRFIASLWWCAYLF